MSEHKWGAFQLVRNKLVRTCARCGLTRRLDCQWRSGKTGKWRSASTQLPPCTGTDALKPTALEWYGDGKLLYLAKRIVVAGITDSDKPCYWLAGGSDDETSKPYESIAVCMQDAESEVRRLLREAGVVLT